MGSVLVGYGTGEGQTETVAVRLAETIGDRGHEVTTVDLGSTPEELSLEGLDAALLGSSVHVGTHHSGVREFVAANREGLRTHPTGFFQLSLSSAVDDPERRTEAAKYVDDFLEALLEARFPEATADETDREGCDGRRAHLARLRVHRLPRSTFSPPISTRSSRDDWVGSPRTNDRATIPRSDRRRRPDFTTPERASRSWSSPAVAGDRPGRYEVVQW